MNDSNNGYLTTADLAKLGTIPLFPAKPDIPKPQMHFDEKNTVQHKIEEQTKQLTKKQQEQIEILKEQHKKSCEQIELLEEQIKKSDKQIELLEKNNHENGRQIRLLNEQVEQSMINYDELKKLYNAKVKELEEAKEDAKKSSCFNRWSLFIAILSLLVAVASLVAAIAAL